MHIPTYHTRAHRGSRDIYDFCWEDGVRNLHSKKPPGFGVRQTRIPLSYFLSKRPGVSFTLAIKTPLCQGYLPPGATVRMRRDYACKTTMDTVPGTKEALNK